MQSHDYEFDVPMEAKIVRDIDTGELYAKFQSINSIRLNQVLEELNWKTPVAFCGRTKFILQSSKSYSSGKYYKYRVIKYFYDEDGTEMIALGTYEDKEGNWIDNVKFSKPRQVSMIRWMKIDKYTVTMKMKIPVDVEVKTTINR